MEIINTIDSKEKIEARDNTLMQNNEQASIIEIKSEKGPSTGILAVICLMSLLTLAMTLISGLYIIKLNTNIKNLNGWNIYSAMRVSLLAESLNMLVSCVIVHDYPYDFTWSSMDDLVTSTYFVTSKLVDADNKLINGSDTTVPIQGFDETLDNINIYDDLMQNTSTLDPQEYYNNLSAHSLIGVYSNYVTSIMTQISNGQNLSVPDVANAIYIPNDRLIYKLIQSRKRCSELATDQLSKLKIFYIIIAVCVIFCVGVYITFVAMYYNNRLRTYRAALFIVKRFSPYVLLSNKMFNKVFLKGNNLKNNKKMSIEHSIIQNANDSIFCTSLQGTVETVNDSVQRLLDYTPEQLLGQKVDLFFANADGETLRQKLEMMKEGQISQFYEDDFTAISDTTQEIPVHTSIIGMIKENETKINSFVIILRDQTALVKQKKQAEDAKAKSEKLLYQILPRDIVLQLNKSEKDISFVVPSATIIFVDINRFSEYAANLSPQDIMANLSLYFACLDKMASRHNMIQKIKLIGDIYMAATGLFNPDVSPESHAEQSIIFGFECIQSLDEINMRLEANLAIRIGINSGGPIIAGVLGTDKPVFDIIGDAINISARLQTTCEINHVHISQATYDLVKDMNFELTKRGETFLKGKGKQMTYYASSSIFVLNHSDISV
ncbi:Adenylate and Guanylate cyclase catalytic domain containing protein [Trichomonas vaginalis G3]|uniref:Adenylate and Guanylate cyclase catalytic domain containing protein n=1 Tax=Trichomonas vaginalis (strain ATCC PRA-98 / G3) TaxID=412133 RepID=A2DYW0_TRIV3|nr:guanylate cyclase protein [Trichomonas vaginalis G3]EAY14371.1 Adenylate and Guanylate cyclase catalytic domain containing protein [Trichomonas vaginalis G3]KAI5501279.1 guanylate cyclase protein [Trichomonas vaginalis G3]|eukprot:XP_001326594.1 Adenylate and Guanylate cyclase catalytic domain containing protein [Trichomonas vaginalis G3]